MIEPKTQLPIASRMIMKSLGHFSFLILLSIAVSACFFKAPISPIGIWTYPGGAVEPMSMVFNADGKLTFVGGFTKFQPATWKYDKLTQKMQIKVSNYDKSDNECGAYNEEYACLLYNSKTDSFECKWTEKTKSLSFLGWNFLRK